MQYPWVLQFAGILYFEASNSWQFSTFYLNKVLIKTIYKTVLLFTTFTTFKYLLILFKYFVTETH